MNFNILSPCNDCPFRSDVRPYLTKARAAEITRDVLLGDKTFACHKTTGIETGRRVLRKNRSHCAGAMIIVKKTGWRNALLQIAGRLGLLDATRLDMTAPVFESSRAFIDAQEY